MAKTPPGRDPIRETIPETSIGGFIQVSGHSVTKVREKIAAVMEPSWKVWTVTDLQKYTELPQKSIRRALELLLQKKLAHYSPRFKAYFLCKKLMASGRNHACHSFGICERCHAVREFVHASHEHPHFPNMKVFNHEHEWLTHCLTCKE